MIINVTARLTEAEYDVAEAAYNKILEEGFTEELQEIACHSPEVAWRLAANIQGADIAYCQKAACGDPIYAVMFARDVKGADIAYCQKYACSDDYMTYLFASRIIGADIEYCEAHMGEYLEGYLKEKMAEALK